MKTAPTVNQGGGLGPASPPDRLKMRCASVTDNVALAVVRLDRICAALEPALIECLMEFRGVSQVHVDSSRGTVQILYDGERSTEEKVLRFLQLTGWLKAQSAALQRKERTRE